MLEQLESRRLFSAYFSGPTLNVSGTEGDDVISFLRDGDKLIADVNGERSEFNLADVRTLAVYAGGGDDLVVIGRLTVRTAIDGGAGDDTISGGRGGDIIDGGTGSDVIFGLDGDDWIEPGYQHELDPDLNADLAADTVSGGAGKDEVHEPESHDVISACEATDVGKSSPVFIFGIFGPPRVSFVTRPDGHTYARVVHTFSDLGYFMEVLNVRRDGEEIVVSLEARRHRGGAGQAIQEYKVEADLGALPDGSYRVRVVDRWGGTVSATRFNAPVAPPELITPESVRLSTSQVDRAWYLNLNVDLPDSAYELLVGNVRNKGNRFFLEVLAADKEGSSFSGRSGPGLFRLGNLAPGSYSFSVTSEGRTVETINFTV